MLELPPFRSGKREGEWTEPPSFLFKFTPMSSTELQVDMTWDKMNPVQDSERCQLSNPLHQTNLSRQHQRHLESRRTSVKPQFIATFSTRQSDVPNNSQQFTVVGPFHFHTWNVTTIKSTTARTGNQHPTVANIQQSTSWSRAATHCEILLGKMSYVLKRVVVSWNSSHGQD
jgi:hypothetical protein